MSIDRYCQYCHRKIDIKETESIKMYKKRKYHKECQYKGMKQQKTGFFGNENQAASLWLPEYIHEKL